MRLFQQKRQPKPYSLHLVLFVAGFAALLLGLGPVPRDVAHLIASPLLVGSGVAALVGRRSPPPTGAAALPIRRDPGLRSRDGEARFVGFVLVIVGIAIGAVTLAQLVG
jgi:hypothetical protein